MPQNARRGCRRHDEADAVGVEVAKKRLGAVARDFSVLNAQRQEPARHGGAQRYRAGKHPQWEELPECGSNFQVHGNGRQHWEHPYRWDHARWYGGRYYAPQYYAPPIVTYPPAYYGPPSINFNIPLG